MVLHFLRVQRVQKLSRYWRSDPSWNGNKGRIYFLQTFFWKMFWRLGAWGARNAVFDEDSFDAFETAFEFFQCGAKGQTMNVRWEEAGDMGSTE